MVINYAIEITNISSPMIRHFCDTNIVVSLYKQRLYSSVEVYLLVKVLETVRRCYHLHPINRLNAGFSITTVYFQKASGSSI